MNSIRESLHTIIDNFNDEEFLKAVYEILQAKEKQHQGDIWKSLTAEQQKEVIQVAHDIINPEKQVSHDIMLKKNKKWLEK